MGVSKVSWFLYLFGFFLLFNGVFTKPSLNFVKNKAQKEAVVIAKPNYIHSKDIVVPKDDTIYPLSYQVFMPKQSGFTGFRGVFQWSIGKTINVTNYGIHNAIEYSVEDSFKTVLSGDIGIYSNGTQNVLQFSLDVLSADGSSINLGAFKNYSLISNAIYFLDVEINNNTLSGYISEPQTNLSAISNRNLTRSKIGDITWLGNLKNLSPTSYSISNKYISCNRMHDITTYNYLPELYNKTKKVTGELISTLLYPTRMCGPLNTLPMTDWSTVLYIARPNPVINGTSSLNF